jgi:hypothetical protein
MSDLQGIADRVQIEALRGEAADAAMMRDYDRVASLFTPDAVVRAPHIGVELAGQEEILAGGERLQAFLDYFVQAIRGGAHLLATRDRARTTDRCRSWTGCRYRPYDSGAVRRVSMRVTDYSFGSIRVDGVTYDHDLIIDRGKIRKRKKAASRKFRGAYGHTPLSAAEDIPWRCRRLVIGTGADGALPVLQQVRDEARHRKVHLVVLPTAEAIGALTQTTKDTNAILHLTC